MSACNTFTEHVWKPGECKNCFKPKSLHQLPADTEKAALTHGGVRTNANHSNNHRARNTGSFRPPVAKKPTIAVKPTMMVAEGPSAGAELSIQEHCENRPVVVIGWNRNRTALTPKPLNNNNEETLEGFGHVPKPYSRQDSAKKVADNNNGLTDVLKEIAGLDGTPALGGNDADSRETFLGRINNCYKRSLERKLPPSCLMGTVKDPRGKRVVLSGGAEVISNEGGRFCYPALSSEEDSEGDVLSGTAGAEHESWDESDEELLAMEIRMRGQPRFANFRANTLSPVRFFVGKKWNTVPLRNKSLQRICAVDYDDSYDEILNGYEENSVVSYGPGSLQSTVSSDSTSPDSSLTEESRSETASSLSQKICHGGVSSPGSQGDGAKNMKETEPSCESVSANDQEDAPQASKGSTGAPETHKAVLAVRLEERAGKIAVQMERPESKASTDIAGQAVTISLVPVEEQAKPYRVVNLEQPLCKPYTVVDVSAAMASEHLEGPANKPRAKGSSSTPNSPATSPALTPGQRSAHFQKSSAIRYQEVWTSSTSPRQKIPKVELTSAGTGPNIPPRKACHKSAPTSPTATNISSRTIPVKSPNLSEIKFNSYNNAGMPPFPIIIHDEPTYARSSKNAIKVPIVINPNAYDNLAIYKSFLGTSGELSAKEKTASIISHTYEEIEHESQGSDGTACKPTECPHAKGFSSSTEGQRGSVAQKVQEFNNCLSRSQSSPQRSYSSSHSSPTKIPRPTPEPAAKAEDPQEPPANGSSSSSRENASTVLSQIVASIHPPQSPPETPPSGPKACSVEELYAIPPDAEVAKNTPARPKSLFTSQPSGEAEPPQSTESPPTKAQKDPLSKPLALPPSKLVANAQSEPAPPFPPPRSTSSPYHASNLLQRHFTNWTKPTSPTRSTEAESVLYSEGSRRAADAKPKRWISFKSFFRRRKTDEEDDKEKEREKGKLVGLDGTVIHMLPPPPVQRHHWFAETKTESSEKPAIVFLYRCDPAQGQLSVEQSQPGADATAVMGKGGPEDAFRQESEKKRSHSSPTLLPKKILSHVTHEVSAEEFLPRDPRSIVGKQDGGGGCTSGSPALPLQELERGEEGEDASDPMDLSPSSATYSNLGQSRAAMIPPKHPRQPKGALDDTIPFGGQTDQAAPGASQPTPPPLPKKMIIRANTEPISKDLQKSLESSLCVMANPTYDLDPSCDASSAGSSVSCDLKGLDLESSGSLERPLHKERRGPSAASSISSLTTLSVKDRFSNSTESLSSRHGTARRQGRSIQKPQRHALYRGLENREEVVGKIRSLYTDALRKMATKCEDLFMAGQKDQLRFGVDSWSDFRLTSDKPCCEAGDAVYYTASCAKDPLNSYAVKICKSKAKESQQYYHSLAVRQSLAIHFNIQQDCGHFLAEVPNRLLPWEDTDAPEKEEEKVNEAEEEGTGEAVGRSPAEHCCGKEPAPRESQGVGARKQRSHVVVITREVPCLTVADFVRDSLAQHGRSPDVYERHVCLLLLQLCSGLEHLKPYHVTHCDLRLENLLLVHYQPGGPAPCLGTAEPSPAPTGPTRLIVSNFSQARQKSHLVDPEILRDQSRLAPEIVTATQYRKCDEFQTGILIYEMLHLPNPFDEHPELKEREYTCADLPRIPLRSPYSRGLQQLASCLLNPNPSERILISDAKGILQCLLWGPREDLFQTFAASPGRAQRQALLQNWLDIKRTLLLIKFAEKALDREGGVSLEDWLCAQYLAFATGDSLSSIVNILQHR
ncbi:inactive tyrosine-protein kinase PEAK1 isoform X2 [Tenrec ecaudatus]|uniref:inactive tyrosine-protein kinase PEAK1 isoform X2 n=1 Tax=Tenrec ecaudatus TaxID=94439 RepID=UPI003F5A6540